MEKIFYQTTTTLNKRLLSMIVGEISTVNYFIICVYKKKLFSLVISWAWEAYLF